MRLQTRLSIMGCVSGLALMACSDDGADDFETQATLDVKQYVNAQLQQLNKAAEALEKAAPEADDDGWNADDDATAVEKMRAAWGDARNAYERVEGAIAVLFIELDTSTDARYDDFIEEEADADLFDDEGVIGVHAIERILWADQHPERVVRFESTLPGYKAAAFPASRPEAEAFKTLLCARLSADTRELRDHFGSTAIDSTTAYWGMIGSMEEQSEKTTKAATGEDESRYAQYTLNDMRANLEGARAVYGAFRPWIESTAGPRTADDIEADFDEIDDAYREIDGPALPAVPAKFNPDKPTESDLQSAYGKLWQLLNEKTDPEDEASLVSKMGALANQMGIEGIEEE